MNDIEDDDKKYYFPLDEDEDSKLFVRGKDRFQEDNMEQDGDIAKWEKGEWTLGKNSCDYLDKRHGTREGKEKYFKNMGIIDEQSSYAQNEEESRNSVKEACCSKINLSYMEEKIVEKIPLICVNGDLYQYTGRSYKIIKNGEELLYLIRSSISYNAFGSISTNRFNDLLVFLKADKQLIPKECETRLRESQYYISFQNGVLDVRDMSLHTHSKKYLVFYELNAKWNDNPYPKRFLEFLHQTSGGDNSVMIRIQECLGYLLSAVNEGKYFFVMGTASDSGKSTLAEMIQHFIGERYITHLSTYQIGSRFALGDIHGKLLNISMDLPKGKLSPVVVSIIKQITGGDVIMTDQKYERMREVHSGMRFWFASNYPVTVSKEDDDDSFWNRMVIVPFQYSVKKCDMDNELLEKLLSEKDDIIALCLRAFQQVLQRGCIFSECSIAEEMKNQWRNSEKDLIYTLQCFLDDCIQITGDQKDSLYIHDFYEIYKDYCSRNNWECMTYNKVADWCEKNILGCKRKRIHRTGSNPKAGFVGMRFLDSIEISNAKRRVIS